VTTIPQRAVSSPLRYHMAKDTPSLEGSAPTQEDPWSSFPRSGGPGGGRSNPRRAFLGTGANLSHLLDNGLGCTPQPGRNGLSCHAQLTWWGKGFFHNEEWRLAVTDVTAALCCSVNSTLQQTSKRNLQPSGLWHQSQHSIVKSTTSGAKVSVEVTAANRQAQLANEAINNRGLHLFPYTLDIATMLFAVT